MKPLETFATAGLAPRRRLEIWNDLACSTFTPIVADPADSSHFAPQLTRTSINGLCFALVRSDPSLVRHSRAHVARTRERLFFLQLQWSGRSVNVQDGKVARLEPGDFTLFDNTRPYEMVFDATNEVLVLGIPERVLRRYLAYPEDLVACCMPSGITVNRMLSEYLRSLWNQCREGMNASLESTLTRVTLELMVSAYSMLPQTRPSGSHSAAARRTRILRYIEEHLTERDLTPSRIARQMCVTRRYLHLLLRGEWETPARYIMRRRLEECARALGSQYGPPRSVTEVAFEHGFASLAHFGRAFRKQYGISPTQYRERGRSA